MYHPIVNFIFFALVLAITMFVMNPVYLGVSFIGAAVYYVGLRGEKAVKFICVFMLPLFLITAVVTPLFNHEGATIMGYLPSGNPITLESILYGLTAGLMMASAVLWFACVTIVFTSDKFVYLFGRIIPALSLVLSMALRFVPRLIATAKEISRAQKCLGRQGSGSVESSKSETVIDKLLNGVNVLSVLISWSVESSIETADSMNCRGYGLPGRTAFSIYRFEPRDVVATVWLVLCICMLGMAGFGGLMYWRFYPTVKGVEMSPSVLFFELLYLALCLTPTVVNITEELHWKRLDIH